MTTKQDDLLIWAGKRLSECSRDELLKCARHFYAAHTASLNEAARTECRMRHLSEAFSAAQIAKLDRWLSHHGVNAQDSVSGATGKHRFRRWFEDWENIDPPPGRRTPPPQQYGARRES